MTAAPKILYLAHDLTDAAVHRRVMMLKDGGADVTVAGFTRSDNGDQPVAGIAPVSMGRTYNGCFAQRIAAVLRAVLQPPKNLNGLAPDIIIARNLEMLAVGVRLRAMSEPAPALVYESLDIHRLLLGKGIAARILRRLEGWLSRRAGLLVTSSPSFVSEYFNPVSDVRLPVALVENKIYDAQGTLSAAPTQRPAGLPWRIGWFGVIRCRKSLAILAGLVRDSEGAVEVVIRGRPALDQIPDFHQIVDTTPGMSFGGPYQYPADLAEMYGSVHFTWAIDMYEEGLNSSWLLPNRLYEGGMFDAVPIARADVATGAYLRSLGVGVMLPASIMPVLTEFFETLTAERYQALGQAARNVPRRQWRHTREDCRQLVAQLHALNQNDKEHRRYA
ncbi:MAG TPA: glycosyl transferase family 1 [Patescibacteria group bacterium]|nr:glycosyl transferase family 1 [Patescibacteria group bacterium]